MDSQRIYIGTKLKYKIVITSAGFDMDTDNWEVTVKCGGNSQTFAKLDCIHRDNDWFVVFDTEDFGKGTYYAIIKAYVPDTDFDGGIRTEVTVVILCKVMDIVPEIIW